MYFDTIFGNIWMDLTIFSDQLHIFWSQWISFRFLLNKNDVYIAVVIFTVHSSSRDSYDILWSSIRANSHDRSWRRDGAARRGAARRGVITPGLAGGYMASYFHQVASQLPALVQNASPPRRWGRSKLAFYAVQWYFSRHTLLILLANSIEISCTVNDFSYRLAFPRGHAKRMKQKSKNGEKEENHSISLVIFLGGSLPAPV